MVWSWEDGCVDTLTLSGEIWYYQVNTWEMYSKWSIAPREYCSQDILAFLAWVYLTFTYGSIGGNVPILKNKKVPMLMLAKVLSLS